MNEREDPQTAGDRLVQSEFDKTRRHSHVTVLKIILLSIVVSIPLAALAWIGGRELARQVWPVEKKDAKVAQAEVAEQADRTAHEQLAGVAAALVVLSLAFAGGCALIGLATSRCPLSAIALRPALWEYLVPHLPAGNGCWRAAIKDNCWPPDAKLAGQMVSDWSDVQAKTSFDHAPWRAFHLNDGLCFGAVLISLSSLSLLGVLATNPREIAAINEISRLDIGRLSLGAVAFLAIVAVLGICALALVMVAVAFGKEKSPAAALPVPVPAPTPQAVPSTQPAAEFR